MYLPGVGPKRKEILAKELQINTWGDLLEYYPYKYVDRSKVYTINELNGNMPFVQLKGKILSFEEFATTPRKKRLVAHFSDGHGVVDLVWFRGVQYVSKTYQLGVEYIVFGKPSVYGGRFQFAHPEMEEATTLQLNEMGMQPYYITTERMKNGGITSRAIEKLTKPLIARQFARNIAAINHTTAASSFARSSLSWHSLPPLFGRIAARTSAIEV